MTNLEINILDNHMTEYPVNKTFEEVLTLIFEEDESVVIWEPFENWIPKEFVNHLRALNC